MHGLSDANLVVRCIRGEKSAWEEFVGRFSDVIFWAIKKKLNCINHHYNQQDIEDIFQDVFILLWSKGKLRQIKDRVSISGWLVMVAANCTVDYLRSKRIWLARSETLTDKADFADYTASESIDREKTAKLLDEVLQALPAREVIVLKLNYLYDKTHQQIAGILKIPQNSVSSIIKRTKERLRQGLKKQGL